MPNDSLTELARVIAQGLPGPNGGLRRYIDALFGDRYQKRHHSSTAVRDAYALADGDEGVPYAGMVNPENPPSGPYGGTSVVWFPSQQGGTLIDFGIGTRGLPPDEGILTRPGHKRRVTALRRYLARAGVDTWVKHDPSALGSAVPKTVRDKYAGFEHVFKRYGSELYACAVVPKDLERARIVVQAFVDLYAFERGWQILKAYENEYDAFHAKLRDDIFAAPTPDEVHQLLKARRFVVLQGPPGTGKTRMADEIRKRYFGGNGFTVQFHPAVTYEDFIVGLSPDAQDNALRFEVRRGWLVEAARKAKAAPFLLIIDEINRADLGRVLGEAIYLFEAAEVGGEHPRRVRLPHPVDGETELSLPPNLFVLATMNTADRSIASMDLAVRRRFAFVTLPPERAAVASRNVPAATAAFDRVADVFVEHAPGEALHLMPGHAYFLVKDERELYDRLRFEVIPLSTSTFSKGSWVSLRMSSMPCETDSRTRCGPMASPHKGQRRPPARVALRHAGSAPQQKQLFKARDHGPGVVLHAEAFAPPQRGGGWGPFADSFLRMNERALSNLEVRAEIGSSDAGVRVVLVPGGRAGAIPLRSAQTGNVAAGLVIEPRFGWSGVGDVLSQTGWAATPEFLDGPLVPGSGREVPPWVIAGPVLARIGELLDSLRRGYHAKEEVLRQPRGRIVWNRYISESLTSGRWGSLPCRYPELASDPLLRRMARWGLERVRLELVTAGGRDPVARLLVSAADELLFRVKDVQPLMPRRIDLERIEVGDRLLQIALRRGLEALGWVVEERGLGGGREMDGLAWSLSLHQLWEHYVESIARREAALVGGNVRVGRRRETVFPLEWSDPSHRSLGHLVPDIVVFMGKAVQVIDAKYKAHLAELDEHGWVRFTDDRREAHRADVHQVLAYASLYSADEVIASLVYPLRRATFEALARRGRDRSVAHLLHGGRRVRVELRGVSFGTADRTVGI